MLRKPQETPHLQGAPYEFFCNTRFDALPAHLWSPRQHLPCSSLFSRGNQPSERLLSSFRLSLHRPLSQRHKFNPQFHCLPGADEALNGGFNEISGIVLGLEHSGFPTLGARSTATNCRACGQSREVQQEREIREKTLTEMAAHVFKGHL